MTRKKNENEYEIQPTSSMPTIANHGPITPFTPDRAQSKEERWIQAEYRKRMAVEQALTIEAQYAVDANAYLAHKVVTSIDKTSSRIFDVKSAERDESLQPYMDKVCKRALEELATRQFGIYEVAVANIAYTVHRDHYPPEMEDDNKSWLAMLFGV